MVKTSCYIDGFNLYHAIDALGVQHLKWLNLRALAEQYLRPDDELDSVVYFSAIMVWNQVKQQRHKEYINALKSVRVEPVLSKFLKTSDYCVEYKRYCGFREEKQTDVNFSTRVLSDVVSQGVERVILITADSDQVPTVAAVRGLAPKVTVSIACPPGRKSIAKELTYVAHDGREIQRGTLDRCLFPRNVRNAKGAVVAKCPALYEHPKHVS